MLEGTMCQKCPKNFLASRQFSKIVYLLLFCNIIIGPRAITLRCLPFTSPYMFNERSPKRFLQKLSQLDKQLKTLGCRKSWNIRKISNLNVKTAWGDSLIPSLACRNIFLARAFKKYEKTHVNFFQSCMTFLELRKLLHCEY